jgi:hypothetical protein
MLTEGGEKSSVKQLRVGEGKNIIWVGRVNRDCYFIVVPGELANVDVGTNAQS